jgi:hypothetical protein
MQPQMMSDQFSSEEMQLTSQMLQEFHETSAVNVQKDVQSEPIKIPEAKKRNFEYTGFICFSITLQKKNQKLNDKADRQCYFHKPKTKETNCSILIKN